MLTKILIIAVMLVIVGSLASGLIFLVRDKGHSNRMVKALSWRIGLSIFLFVLLFIAFALGWISPHPIG